MRKDNFHSFCFLLLIRSFIAFNIWIWIYINSVLWLWDAFFYYTSYHLLIRYGPMHCGYKYIKRYSDLTIFVFRYFYRKYMYRVPIMLYPVYEYYCYINIPITVIKIHFIYIFLRCFTFSPKCEAQNHQINTRYQVIKK